MKNCICLSSVCLLILFASGAALAQEAPASRTPQSERPSISDPPCPTITVSCPSGIEVGKPLEFKATIHNLDPVTVPTYTWEVVGGMIAEGHGTSTIMVNKVGPLDQTVIAALRVGGLDAACPTTASCSTVSCRFPPHTKFDSYGVVSINNERARLNLFAAELKQQPGAQGYILGYGGRLGRAGEAQKAVDRAKKYLVNKLGVNEGRIVTVDAGLKEEPTIDLWLVPTGATPPATEPTVSNRSKVD